MTQRKPIICSFFKLSFALRRVHLGVKADVDSLHDIWLMGAPVPSSRILQPKIYDPRLPQIKLGNREERIVFPKKLGEWIRDVLQRRGLEISEGEAYKLVSAVSKAHSQVYRSKHGSS